MSGQLARRFTGVLASICLALLLIVCLLRFARLDTETIAETIAVIRFWPVLAITILLGGNSFLAGEKWRIVVLRIDPETGHSLPRSLYFALSAVGVGFGQLLPVQASTALSRWLGSRAFGGRPVLRGVGATLIEQLFDVIAAVLLVPAAILVLVTHTGPSAWLAMVLTFSLSGVVLCNISEPLVAYLARLTSRFAITRRLGLVLSGLKASGVAASAVTRPLLLLSLLRLVVLTLISAVSAAAVGGAIPLWQLAAAFPFGIIGTAVSLTPGGIGTSEWGVVSVLAGLGTPLQTAVRWAIACRLLVMCAAIVGAAVGAVTAALTAIRTPPSSFGDKSAEKQPQ